MIKSMTAFANSEQTIDDISIKVEIRTYNSRYLDIQLRMTPGYQVLEEKLKTLITGCVARGRVDVKIHIDDLSDAAVVAFDVDETKARAYHQALKTLKKLLDLEGSVSLELITARNDLIKPREVESDVDKIWACLADCMQEVLSDIDAMRQKEGAFIANDFRERLHFLEDSIDQIEADSSGLLEQYKLRLMERISVLTEQRVSLDEGRIEQEAAFLTDKSDISEEIIRVRSHLAQFEAIMAAGAPSGHKLNFLMQEINREFNTIGSKSAKTDISHIVVNVKSELEKIREQVQNVE
ncbi:MAG: YicC family protein [Deltaproteobacteria bacterium]|nr:MAG: YicC family protein [Deltaproteobacteria bacterium]RLC15031.1 MAG: YicC family protein [Deltaproteobacteria bacterium]